LITSQFFRLMAVFWRFPDLMSPPPSPAIDFADFW
jgi:hypothetical protein